MPVASNLLEDIHRLDARLGVRYLFDDALGFNDNPVEFLVRCARCLEQFVLCAFDDADGLIVRHVRCSVPVIRGRAKFCARFPVPAPSSPSSLSGCPVNFQCETSKILPAYPKDSCCLSGRQDFLVRNLRDSRARVASRVLTLNLRLVHVLLGGFGLVSEGAKPAAPPLSRPAILRFALAGRREELMTGIASARSLFGRLRRADELIISRRCVR